MALGEVCCSEQSVQGIPWKKKHRVQEPEWVEEPKETRPSKSTGSKNSHSLKQRAQGLQGSASDGVLELKGEVDTYTHS